MKKFRIREEKSYSKDGRIIFSTYYPERLRKLLGLIPIWISVDDNPFTAFSTLDSAKECIQIQLALKLNSVKQTKTTMHPVCTDKEEITIIEC